MVTCDLDAAMTVACPSGGSQTIMDGICGEGLVAGAFSPGPRYIVEFRGERGPAWKGGIPSV